MKTGIIIEAEITDKGLNDIVVKRTFVHGEEWVRSQPELNTDDANEFIDLMVEGIQTIIMALHDKGLADSAAMYRETLEKMDKAFIQPCITSVTKTDDKKKYKGQG
jgi:hypothetical protein